MHAKYLTHCFSLVCVLCTMLLPPTAYADDANNEEAALQVKAQFIYNFANYVEWPFDAFANEQSPIKACLFGEVDFSPYLNAFAGVMIGERELVTISTTNLDDIRSGCHLLFVGEDRQVELPTFWSNIQYLYVLSIGEKQGFADKGGIIKILRTRDQLQFDVNINNAIVNGLFLDSDLLALARVIKSHTEAGAP